MSTYHNLNNEPELLKIKTRDDEIKDRKYQTEKHDHENKLKSLKIEKELCEKKYKGLNKKNIISYHLNFDWIRICYFNVDYVINKSKHWYSAN